MTKPGDEIRVTPEAHDTWLTIPYTLEKWQINDLVHGKTFRFCDTDDESDQQYEWLFASTGDEPEVTSADGSCVSGQYDVAVIKVDDSAVEVVILRVGPWGLVLVPNEGSVADWLTNQATDVASLAQASLFAIVPLA